VLFFFVYNSVIIVTTLIIYYCALISDFVSNKDNKSNIKGSNKIKIGVVKLQNFSTLNLSQIGIRICSSLHCDKYDIVKAKGRSLLPHH